MNHSQHLTKHDIAIKKTKDLCKKLKHIVNEIENIIEPSTSLPNQQNNNVRIAGVSGSVIDNSYHYWTTSLRN